MTVYVDNNRAAYGRMQMCHMMADSTEELVLMADKIGVARRWIQKAGTSHEHFDICLAKRASAVRHGAVPVETRYLCGLILKRRNERHLG